MQVLYLVLVFDLRRSCCSACPAFQRKCYNLSTCHSHSLQPPLYNTCASLYIYISCALYTPLVLITTKTTYLTITQQYLLHHPLPLKKTSRLNVKQSQYNYLCGGCLSLWGYLLVGETGATSTVTVGVDLNSSSSSSINWSCSPIYVLPGAEVDSPRFCISSEVVDVGCSAC